jgi:hypothetical protein
MHWFPTEPEGDRNSMNDRTSAALGPQTRELTEAELDAVSGGSFQWGVGMSSGGDRPSESLTISSYQSGGHGATALIPAV